MNAPATVVTGAGRGIGLAAARRLASLGHRLLLVARSAEGLAEAARLCGGETRTLAADVSDPAAAGRIVEEAIARFGRIDAVINNAGAAPQLSVEETSVEEWRRVLDTNLSAAFYLAKAAWPHLKRQGGAIVNLSSMAAKDPFPGFAAYASAKAGVNLLTLSLAREGAPHGIRVHAIAPGAVETAMFRGLVSPDVWPAEKTLSPDDVADTIARCITGELRHTSGQVIYLTRTP